MVEKYKPKIKRKRYTLLNVTRNELQCIKNTHFPLLIILKRKRNGLT